MNSPWADYIRALRTEVPELLGYMFPNFKKRYCGDEWLVDCLDFVLQAVDWEEDEVGNRDLAFSGISQGTKNSLYKSEWLTEREQTYYLNVFQKLSEYMTQIIDESNDKQERKRLRRKVLSQNLFWMMCNGINSLEQAKEAVRLHEIATANKLRFFGKKGQEHDDLTFKNACEGSRVANIAFRYEILTEIIGDVTAKFTEEIRSSLEA